MKVAYVMTLLSLGIIAARWRLLHTTIIAEPEKAAKLVKAMCVLHNYLRTNEDLPYAPSGFCDAVQPNGAIRDGSW